jgi:hypothetical protein
VTDQDDEGVFETSVSDDPRYEAVFEDDGEVAFGYMLRDRDIIADVWLYNVVPVPGATVARFRRVSSLDEISFNRSYSANGTVEAVEFWIRGRRHARVTPGSKPGWCVLATADGPLARKLD